ncbi:MAG: restriction endonuclease subunit S, partial [Kiritimatiellia bacterium]
RRKETEDGQEVVLRLRDIRAGWIDYSEVNRITLTPSEATRYVIQPGNLLFIRVNGNPEYVGRCALFTGYPEPVYFNDHIMRVTLRKNLVDGVFITTILNSSYGKRQIASHRKTSAGQHTINQEGLCGIRLPLPPLALQREFAGRVAAVERLKAAQRASLAELDELFASLQHRAFRGEL